MNRLDYSFVIPIYNDGALAEDFCLEFERVFSRYLGLPEIAGRAELIFVDDGSQNDSARLLQALCGRFKFVRMLGLSRNFGQHIALACGYRHASGRFVASINVDMEDPIEQLPLLLDRIQAGDVDLAIGLRKGRHGSLAVHLSSRIFNLALNRLTGHSVPLNVSTVRIMTRRFVDAYNRLPEKSPFLPGLETWLGFERAYVDIEQRPRARGRSTYTMFKRFKMGFNAVLSFSDLPLRMAVSAGTVIAAMGIFSGLFLVVAKLFFVNYRPGYTSMMSIIVFLGGVQILVVGLSGLYIGRILKEVQNRPLYVLKHKTGFEDAITLPDVS